jgi:hypothetical protein
MCTPNRAKLLAIASKVRATSMESQDAGVVTEEWINQLDEFTKYVEPLNRRRLLRFAASPPCAVPLSSQGQETSLALLPRRVGLACPDPRLEAVVYRLAFVKSKPANDFCLSDFGLCIARKNSS